MGCLRGGEKKSGMVRKLFKEKKEKKPTRKPLLLRPGGMEKKQTEA